MKIAAPVAAAAKRSPLHHFIIVPEVSQLKQPCFLCFIAIILHFLLKLTDVSCRTPAAGRIPAPVPAIGSRACSCSQAPERPPGWPCAPYPRAPDRWYKARILPAGRPAENFVRSILSARKKHPPPGIFRPGSGCFPLYYGERCRRFTLRQHSW